MVGVLLHVEDSRVVGILPSMLESIRLYAKSFGVTAIHIVDGTEDGYFGGVGDAEIDCQRFATLSAWWDAVGSTADAVVGMETQNTIEAAGETAHNIMEFQHPESAWYVFGPSMGIDAGWIDSDKEWVYLPTLVPVGAFNSREALTLTLAHRFFMLVLGSNPWQAP
jgi:hypothetical protein